MHGRCSSPPAIAVAVSGENGGKRERFVRVEVPPDHHRGDRLRDRFADHVMPVRISITIASCALHFPSPPTAVTFPLDTVKTRLQVSREMSGHPRNGAIKTTVSLGEGSNVR